ncbi:MAG: VWA domain-containing protein [Gammaproteobacteria bacterium]|jgi:Ca-activated chloride channel family protein|nr:VWA domain-containing protein [Gammaproteobacteria bacterium]
MFSFAWPWFAVLLPLPLILGALTARRRVRVRKGAEDSLETSLFHPNVIALEKAYGGEMGSVSGTAGRFYRLFLMLLWTALVLAMMRPQTLELHAESRTRGHDLLLAVDASRSMGALDFSVNGREISRMSVLKGVAGSFVEGREGDRIGLVLFGDYAYILSPFTHDVQAVRHLLGSVEPSIVGDATAMGDGIGLGVKKLKERPEGARVMVLVTDGESTAGLLPPLMAARLAAREGIRIYTIGVGSMGLVPFIEGGVRKQVAMEIDEDTLRQIAELTGGAYFRATDAQALEEIYRRIDELEQTEVEAREVLIPRPLFYLPLAIAAVVLAVLGLFPQARRRFRRGGA